MKKIMCKTKLVTALSVSFMGASLSVSASECDAIPSKAYAVLESEVNKINDELKSKGLGDIDIRDGELYLNMKSEVDNQVAQMVRKCKKDKKEAEERLARNFLLNPMGEGLYQIAYATILEPLGAGGAKNDLNQAVHRIMNPVELVVAVSKEVSRVKENLGDLESDVRNGLGDLESDIRNGLSDLESKVRNDMSDIESKVRNSARDAERKVRHGARSAERTIRHALKDIF